MIPHFCLSSPLRWLLRAPNLVVSLETHYVISSDLFTAALGPFIEPTQRIIQQGTN